MQIPPFRNSLLSQSCFVVIWVATLITIACFHAGAQQERFPSVRVTLTKGEFLPFEPLLARIKLQNETKSPILGLWKFSNSHSLSHIHLFTRHVDGQPSGPFVLYHAAYRSAGGPPDPPPTPLQPGDNVGGEVLLTCSSSLVGELGEFELQAEYLAHYPRKVASDPIRVRVVKGSPVDEKARAFILQNGLDHLLSDEAVHYRPSPQQVEHLRQLVDQFSASLYAAYAEVALASLLIETKTWRGDEQRILKWLQDAKRRHSFQLEDATLFYESRYHALVQRDPRAAEKALRVLRERYPNSRFVKEKP